MFPQVNHSGTEYLADLVRGEPCKRRNINNENKRPNGIAERLTSEIRIKPFDEIQSPIEWRKLRLNIA